MRDQAPEGIAREIGRWLSDAFQRSRMRCARPPKERTGVALDAIGARHVGRLPSKVSAHRQLAVKAPMRATRPQAPRVAGSATIAPGSFLEPRGRGAPGVDPGAFGLPRRAPWEDRYGGGMVKRLETVRCRMS
jgi:hypothetical protein